MRRWVFLPPLVLNVPGLVLYKGGDALSICLNTVAILFMCDIDNIAFDLALGERVRARVEDAGRVRLDDGEASALTRTKTVHVVLIVLAVLVSIIGPTELSYKEIPFVAFLLGGLAEVFVVGASAAEKAKHAVEVFVAWLLGHGGFLLLKDLAS